MRRRSVLTQVGRIDIPASHPAKNSEQVLIHVQFYPRHAQVGVSFVGQKIIRPLGP